MYPVHTRRRAIQKHKGTNLKRNNCWLWATSKRKPALRPKRPTWSACLDFLLSLLLLCRLIPHQAIIWIIHPSYYSLLFSLSPFLLLLLQVILTITQQPFNCFTGKSHPFGLENAWVWIARLLNAPPRRITPTLVHKFLTVASHALLRQYGRQFVKVLDVISKQVLPRIEAQPNKHVPSLSRLQLLMTEFVSTRGANLLAPPEGRNFAD